MRDPMIRTCAACGTKNRVPVSRFAETGRRGACQAPLPPIGGPAEVDALSFDRIVRQAAVPAPVESWAEWCAPCWRAAPEIHAFAQQLAGRPRVLKLETEANPDLAVRYRVRGITAFIVFPDGGIVLQRAGVASRTEMRRWLSLRRAPAAERWIEKAAHGTGSAAASRAAAAVSMPANVNSKGEHQTIWAH